MVEGQSAAVSPVNSGRGRRRTAIPTAATPRRGLVEPELLLDLGNQLRRRLLAGKPDGGIARRHDVEDRERDQRHDQDDENDPEKAPDHVTGPSRTSAFSRGRRGRILDRRAAP